MTLTLKAVRESRAATPVTWLTENTLLYSSSTREQLRLVRRAPHKELACFSAKASLAVYPCMHLPGSHWCEALVEASRDHGTKSQVVFVCPTRQEQHHYPVRPPAVPDMARSCTLFLSPRSKFLTCTKSEILHFKMQFLHVHVYI